MDGITFEVFLLLVVLILLGITLFLSLVCAIYMIRLHQLMTTSAVGRGREVPLAPAAVAETVLRPVEEATTATPPAQVKPSRAETRPIDLSRDARDIPSGMGLICTKYGLESLIVSSDDGLVIASNGDTRAVEDAAHYSQVYQIGDDLDEKGVQVFGMDFRGTPLIGIIRSAKTLDDNGISSIRRDIGDLLSIWI